MEEDIIVGKCMLMCPMEEVKLRERETLLHSFEILSGTSKHPRPKADYDKVVKEYNRPAAGKDDLKPHELRPAKILMKTVDYLMMRIVSNRDYCWDHIYHYVFNRARAVRQDMVIQRIEGEAAIEILEKIIRFHVYAGYRLCSEEISKFDSKINDTHIQECLKRLLLLYQLTKQEHKNQEDFESIYLLYNLESTESFLHIIQLPFKIRESNKVQCALGIGRCYSERNFVRFFRLVKKLSPLECCAVHRHCIHMQRMALVTMSVAFSSKNLKYPLKHLCALLSFESERNGNSVCCHLGINIVDNSVCFLKGTVNEKKLPAVHFQWIDNMLVQHSVSNLIRGIPSEDVDRVSWFDREDNEDIS